MSSGPYLRVDEDVKDLDWSNGGDMTQPDAIVAKVDMNS